MASEQSTEGQPWFVKEMTDTLMATGASTGLGYSAMIVSDSETVGWMVFFGWAGTLLFLRRMLLDL